MAIIARGLGLTAVVGLRDFYQRTRTGDRIIVDGQRGEVILNPSSETISEYDFQTGGQAEESTLLVPEHGPVTTRDGVSIALRANVELPTEFESVRRFGACGVGLFRSEFLLTRPGLIVSEEAQFAVYCDLAQAAGSDGAVVRLFDVGGEGGRDQLDRVEKNPALGLRAIRFSLRHQEMMRAQLRAIFRAAAVGRLSLLLPMVADVSDVRMAKLVIGDVQRELSREGAVPAVVRIGAMIEVPSAVLTAERIAREVDFFELGTNDLVQYTLAVDRGNDDVASWFRTLHPAVLYGIQRTLDAARDAGIPVIVCGEMASTPAYAVLLAGLGAVDLSMTPTSIARVRRVLAAIETKDAKRIIGKCLDASTADEVEEMVRREFSELWPDLFPPRALPSQSDSN
jgi:phosphotransferase system enzyme I (PtsI)